jgi:hypothetical protein
MSAAIGSTSVGFGKAYDRGLLNLGDRLFKRTPTSVWCISSLCLPTAASTCYPPLHTPFVLLCDANDAGSGDVPTMTLTAPK